LVVLTKQPARERAGFYTQSGQKAKTTNLGNKPASRGIPDQEHKKNQASSDTFSPHARNSGVGSFYSLLCLSSITTTSYISIV
jgi:hypothetical protein